MLTTTHRQADRLTDWLTRLSSPCEVSGKPLLTEVPLWRQTFVIGFNATIYTHRKRNTKKGYTTNASLRVTDSLSHLRNSSDEKLTISRGSATLWLEKQMGVANGKIPYNTVWHRNLLLLQNRSVVIGKRLWGRYDKIDHNMEQSKQCNGPDDK